MRVRELLEVLNEPGVGLDDLVMVKDNDTMEMATPKSVVRETHPDDGSATVWVEVEGY